MKVCRFWYKVVANSPELWDVVRNLYCDERLEPGFDRWIRVPRIYTLDLTFSALPNPVWEDELPSLDIWKQEAEPYLERLIGLCIQDCYTQSEIIFPQLRTIAAKCIKLTTLNLQNIHDTPTFQNQVADITATFPVLQTLQLVNWSGMVHLTQFWKNVKLSPSRR